MASDPCERCGDPASVTVAAVRPNRGGVRPTPSEHRYCRACARAMGVPIPQRSERPAAVTEPEPPTWSDIEFHLAQYETILLEEPSFHEHVLSLANQLMFSSKRLPGPMPKAVADAFARIGISTA